MSGWIIALAIVGLYLVISVLLGWWGHRRGMDSVQDYFVASRGIGPFVLFFTLIATNFSAFYYMGFAGAAYHRGFAFYGMMAVGTSLVGVSLLLVGVPIWRRGRDADYLTPPEFVTGETGSRGLGLLFAAVLVVFTLPYLAVQPLAAGIILEQLSGGALSQFQGAALLTAVVIAYLWMGGMRSSALTDVFQGIAMFVLVIAAVFIVVHAYGGFGPAGEAAYEARPDLFRRQGNVGIREWISFMLLWPMVVPMFPQMFSRFYIARDARALRTSAWLYPLVIAVLHLAPVFLGVLGHVEFPGLTGKAADDIVPMLLERHAPLWLAATVLTGAIAAFMSTADSQLLALSSILTRDVAHPVFDLDSRTESWLGRILIAVLAVAGLAVAYQPPGTIFTIVEQAFTGLVVLFPTTVAVVYRPDIDPSACIASIAIGEGLVLWGMLSGGLPTWLLWGFHPSTPVVAGAALVLTVVEFARSSGA